MARTAKHKVLAMPSPDEWVTLAPYEVSIVRDIAAELGVTFEEALWGMVEQWIAEHQGSRGKPARVLTFKPLD